MSDSVTEQVEAILDECEHELNPQYEPALLKERIETAIRAARELAWAGCAVKLDGAPNVQVALDAYRTAPGMRVIQVLPVMQHDASGYLTPVKNSHRRVAIAAVQLLARDKKIVLRYWTKDKNIEIGSDATEVVLAKL